VSGLNQHLGKVPGRKVPRVQISPFPPIFCRYRIMAYYACFVTRISVFDSLLRHQFWSLPMKLSEVPFSEINVGDKLISAIGTSGQIRDVRHSKKYMPNDKDGDEVTIDWESGNSSWIRHYEGIHIEYLGQ
jgi:hypothetical protein